MSEWHKNRLKGEKELPLRERLKRMTKLNEATGCWEWQGALRWGYGRMSIGSRIDGTRKSESAHRTSYKEFVGLIPEGYEICHKCDNRCCINPEHLFAGTRQDNVDDREAKGRNNPQYGIKHPNAKLTEYTAFMVRVLNSKGMSHYRIAKGMGLDKGTIRAVCKGETWKHIPFPTPPEKENQ